MGWGTRIKENTVVEEDLGGSSAHQRSSSNSFGSTRGSKGTRSHWPSTVTPRSCAQQIHRDSYPPKRVLPNGPGAERCGSSNGSPPSGTPSLEEGRAAWPPIAGKQTLSPTVSLISLLSLPSLSLPPQSHSHSPVPHRSLAASGGHGMVGAVEPP